MTSDSQDLNGYFSKLFDKLTTDWSAGQDDILDVVQSILKTVMIIAEMSAKSPGRAEILAAVEVHSRDLIAIIQQRFQEHENNCCDRGKTQIREHHDEIIKVLHEKFGAILTAIAPLVLPVEKEIAELRTDLAASIISFEKQTTILVDQSKSVKAMMEQTKTSLDKVETKADRIIWGSGISVTVALALWGLLSMIKHFQTTLH